MLLTEEFYVDVKPQEIGACIACAQRFTCWTGNQRIRGIVEADDRTMDVIVPLTFKCEDFDKWMYDAVMEQIGEATVHVDATFRQPNRLIIKLSKTHGDANRQTSLT